MDSITMTAEQQLPEGWETQPLQNLLSYVIGGDWGKDENYDDENFILVNCIRGAEFRNWKNDKASTAALRKIKISSLQNRQIQEDDILIEISGGGPEQPVGRTVLITKQVLSNFNNPVVCTNFLRLIRPNEKINSTFLNYYLSYFYLSGKIISYQAGSNNLRNLKFTENERIEIPVPPIETQQAIVNKIESLFDEIDEGIGRLKTAAQQIQQYRQSLLKNAFNGELTKEWRSKHADALPSENELLAQIQTTREQHHAQQLADWQTAVSQWEQNGKEGKKPSKPILKKITTNISDNEIKIPDKYWFVGLFGDLVDIKSNLVKPDEYLDFPHIAPDNIEKNTGKLLSFKTIREDEVISPKHYFYAGQIIYSKIRPNLSKLVLVDFNGLCSADMYPLESDVFNHYFLKYIMLSRYFVKKASTAGSRSVLPKINQSELGMIPIPICSLAEQTQIVAILESKLTACDQLAAELAKQLKQAELLKQAVLKAAFSGSLLDK